MYMYVLFIPCTLHTFYMLPPLYMYVFFLPLVSCAQPVLQSGLWVLVVFQWQGHCTYLCSQRPDIEQKIKVQCVCVCVCVFRVLYRGWGAWNFSPQTPPPTENLKICTYIVSYPCMTLGSAPQTSPPTKKSWIKPWSFSGSQTNSFHSLPVYLQLVFLVELCPPTLTPSGDWLSSPCPRRDTVSVPSLTTNQL